MVRSPCVTKAKASKGKWTTSVHRRSWGRRGARKLEAGDHSANHDPIRINDRKWICKTCGIYNFRPSDMGGTCTGPPEQWNT
eukprot:2717939-Heterocapsa_arctica.AAC.1